MVVSFGGVMGRVDMWVLFSIYGKEEKSSVFDFVGKLLEVKVLKFLVLSFDVFVKVKRIL